jgi:hypothetical protein
MDDATLYRFYSEQTAKFPKVISLSTVAAFHHYGEVDLLSFHFKLTEYLIRCWTFNVRCSMFILFNVPAKQRIIGELGIC